MSGQNTEKSPGDSRRLAVTETAVRNHRLTLVGKTLERVKCKLAKKEYKTRHNWMRKVIHWELRKKLKFDNTSKWCMHNLKSVKENEKHKILSDFKIQTDPLILARRPDLVIVNNNNNRKKKMLLNCGVYRPGRPKSKTERKRKER